MREQITLFLNRPFPLFFKSFRGRSYFAFLLLLLSIGVNFYQPFGLTHWGEYHKGLVLTAYCFVFCGTYVCIHLIYMVLHPDFFKPERWTIGKELQILLIYLFIMAFTTQLFVLKYIPEFKLSIESFFRLQLYNDVSVAGIALLFGFIVSKKLKSKLNDTENPVNENEHQAELQEVIIPKKDIIQWKDIVLEPTKILFAECKGNYLNVHYLHNDKLKVIKKRYSLKDFKLLVAAFPQLVQCHISFMVNMDHVQSWSKGTKNLTLYLDFDKLTVTVTETFIEGITQLLDANLTLPIKKAKTIPEKKEKYP